MSEFVVVVDAGHGGSDSGIVSNGIKEKDLTLATAKACEKELKRHNVKVIMTRTTDVLNSLNSICDEINYINPDCAVSIHYNGGKGDGTEFWCTYYRKTSKADELGTKILARIEKECKQYNRGLKSKIDENGNDWFGFVRMPKCTSGIIEVAFVDNKKDIVDFDETSEMNKAGIAIAHGILNFLGVPIKPVKKPAKKPIKKPTNWLDFVTNYVMRFRKTASSMNMKNVIGTIPKNVRLPILGIKKVRLGYWVYTEYEGKKGFVKVNRGKI